MGKHSAALYRTAVLMTVIPLAFAGPLGKLALSWGAVPLTIAFWRLLTATAGTLLFTLVSRPSRQALAGLTRRDVLRSSLAGLLLAGHYVSWYSALHLTTIFNVTVLGSLQPFFALAGGWLLYRERVRPAAVGGIVVAAAGAVAMGFLSAADDGQASLTGDALALLTGIFFTGYLLCGQSARKNLPAAVYMVLLYGSCTLFLAAASLLSGTSLWPSDVRVIGVCVLLALTATFLVHSVYNWAVVHVKTVFITVVTLAEPVGATFVGWLMFQESPSPPSMLGGLLVLAGVVIYLLKSRERKIPAVPEG